MIRTLVWVRAHTSQQEWHTLADADGLRQSHRPPGHQRAFPGPNLLPLPLRRDLSRRCSGAAPFLSHFPSRGAVHCMVAAPDPARGGRRERRRRRRRIQAQPSGCRRTGGRARERVFAAGCGHAARERPGAGGRGTDGRLYVSVLSSLICQFSVQLLTWRRKRSGWRWLTQVPKPFACDKTVIGTKSRARGEVHSSLLLFVSAKARNRLKQNPTSELLTATNFVAAASLFILIR